jgi:hypothetical protein
MKESETFRLTPDSLAAIREDVLHPWVGRTTKTIRGKFLRQRRVHVTRGGAAARFSLQVQTP